MRNHSETRLHICVANWLFDACPWLLWTHPANQGRSPADGAKLKRMGVRAGTPDIVLWHNGIFAAIELKTGSGMSDKQKEFRRKFELAGGKFAVCTSVKDVHDALLSWGINPYPTLMKEPPPTKQEMQRLAMEYYRPK
jgi:hypothetical protein